MLPFPNFEQVIDPKTCAAGYRYYVYQHITEINLKDTGEWVAKVKGSQSYDVEVKLGNGYVEHFKCDCAEGSLGEVCRHVVAVLYHIRESQVQTQQDFANLTSEVQSLVKGISKEEMETFMVEFATRNKNFREKLLEEFGA